MIIQKGWQSKFTMIITSHTRSLLRALILAGLSLFAVPAHALDARAETSFQSGREYYDRGEFDAAIDAFSRAVSLAPDNSSYHHWLGKSYGRAAENSSLLSAYRLAARTRRELERAVELDGGNIGAIKDLIEFYRRAPSFLGGGADKADKLQRRLKEMDGTPPAPVEN